MITLCVPTKNRPAFLERLLRYYAATGCRGVVFIGDSSDPAQAQRNQDLTEALGGHLTLEYRAYPGLSSCECLERLSESVTTPYCAYVADDDFLCTRGIERAIQFLEGHPDYVAAHGRGAILQTEGGGAYGVVTSVRRYPQAVVEAATASGRLTEFFTSSYYALLYSVHRTDTWRAMFQGLGLLQGTTNSNIFKDELIASCVSVIRGRVKGLDGLYLLRHAHDAMYKHPSVYDWVTSREWSPSYEFFRARLTEELMQQDGISGEQAQELLRDVMWPYLARTLTNAWHRHEARRRPTTIRSRVRAIAQRIPGARRVWRGVRAAVRRWRDEMSLEALSWPRSRYHADFLPVYQVVTQGVAGRRGESDTAPGGRAGDGDRGRRCDGAIHHEEVIQ